MAGVSSAGADEAGPVIGEGEGEKRRGRGRECNGAGKFDIIRGEG